MSYTGGFKLRVIETAQSENRSAGSEHNVSEKLVRDWRKKKADLKALPRTRRSQRVGAKLAARATRDRACTHGIWMGIHSIDRARSRETLSACDLYSSTFSPYFLVSMFGGCDYPVRPIHRQIR